MGASLRAALVSPARRAGYNLFSKTGKLPWRRKYCW
jgi:hypothetical protein